MSLVIPAGHLTSANEGAMVLGKADLVWRFPQGSHTSLHDTVTDAIIERSWVHANTKDVALWTADAPAIR